MHIRKHIVDRIKYTELNEIYWSLALKTIATSFITVFIPIYLYKLGYSLTEVFLYFVALNFFLLFLKELAARIIIRIGPKHVMALSYPMMIVYFAMLLTWPTYKWNLFLMVFVSAFEMALFWMSYHFDFSKAKHKDSCTSEVSKVEILISVCGAVTPFIGGVIASRYDISFTFMIAIFFLIFAAIPLFKTSEPYIRQNIDMKKIELKKIWKDLAASFGMGIDSGAASVAWPLFIFFIVKTYENVGIVESVALILTVAISFLVGKYADRTNRHDLIKRGGSLNAFMWLIKTLAQNALHVLAFNIVHAVAFPILKLPFESEFYIHADEEARLEYILNTESAIDIGRALYFLILVISSIYFGLRMVFIIAFVIAAFCAFLTGMMRPALNETKKIC